MAGSGKTEVHFGEDRKIVCKFHRFEVRETHHSVFARIKGQRGAVFRIAVAVGDIRFLLLEVSRFPAVHSRTDIDVHLNVALTGTALDGSPLDENGEPIRG